MDGIALTIPQPYVEKPVPVLRPSVKFLKPLKTKGIHHECTLWNAAGRGTDPQYMVVHQ
jgi:hypothetical protein